MKVPDPRHDLGHLQLRRYAQTMGDLYRAIELDTNTHRSCLRAGKACL